MIGWTVTPTRLFLFFRSPSCLTTSPPVYLGVYRSNLSVGVSLHASFIALFSALPFSLPRLSSLSTYPFLVPFPSSLCSPLLSSSPLSSSPSPPLSAPPLPSPSPLISSPLFSSRLLPFSRLQRCTGVAHLSRRSLRPPCSLAPSFPPSLVPSLLLRWLPPSSLSR